MTMSGWKAIISLIHPTPTNPGTLWWLNSIPHTCVYRVPCQRLANSYGHPENYQCRPEPLQIHLRIVIYHDVVFGVMLARPSTHPSRGVIQYGILVRIQVQKKQWKKGDFCRRLVGSRDLQKGGIFAKMGRRLTEDTPVTPIIGVLW